MVRHLFWPCWLLASVTTGLMAGCMLGHALILGRFLDWMLASDPRLLAASYPAFALSAGRGGLTLFYALAGLQVVAALALLAQTLGVRRHRLGAGVAAVTAVLWPALHYATGFGAVEAVALRSVTPISADVAASFLAWNGLVHAGHATLLIVGLAALLAIPAAARADPAPDPGRPRGGR
jgi:hypothetical protein